MGKKPGSVITWCALLFFNIQNDEQIKSGRDVTGVLAQPPHKQLSWRAFAERHKQYSMKDTTEAIGTSLM